jgi:hypothetical protein
MEIWKDVIGYEGLYQVSNLGNVVSNRSKKTMKPFLNSSGYLRLCLCKNGKTKKHYIHRLVAYSFNENKNTNLQVNHIDGNKTNNNVLNLEIITARENLCHYFNREDRCVYFRKDSKKWRVIIGVKDKAIHLGNFENKEDAIKKRNEFIIQNKLNGKYSNVR